MDLIKFYYHGWKQAEKWGHVEHSVKYKAYYYDLIIYKETKNITNILEGMNDQRNMTPEEALTNTQKELERIDKRLLELKRLIIDKYGVDEYNKLNEVNET